MHIAQAFYNQKLYCNVRMYSLPESQDAPVFMLKHFTVYCNMTVPSCLSGRLSFF